MSQETPCSDDNEHRLENENQPVSARPFLKWAGGKTQLLPKLLSRVPSNYNRYFEPFLGGGALFFTLQPKDAYLSDINEDLVNAYTVIRDDVGPLLQALRIHRYEKDYFYQVRSWDRSADYGKLSPSERAARLIFLNKTCFNGLYRLNSKGFFNVPFGDYKNPRIVNEKNLLACSEILKCAHISKSSFIGIENQVQTGDFVYLDPPYVPLSTTSSFTGYSKEGFSHADQITLRDLCLRLHEKGVLFMLSNSATPVVLELYKNFNCETVSATRAINSKGKSRGQIEEVLVTNY
jgi:DNA adenine methylase